MCNDEGQIVYYDGNGRYDRKCRCDYRKHFSFMSTERIDKCSCSPTTEDCSCYIKLCSKGQILSPGKCTVVFRNDEQVVNNHLHTCYRIHFENSSLYIFFS